MVKVLGIHASPLRRYALLSSRGTPRRSHFVCPTSKPRDQGSWTLGLGKVIALADRIIENESNSIKMLGRIRVRRVVAEWRGTPEEPLRLRAGRSRSGHRSNLSEDPAKVLEAVDLLFGFRLQDWLSQSSAGFVVAEYAGDQALEKVYEQARSRMTIGVLRRLLRQRRGRISTSFLLNKQVAAGGVVVFCENEAESPLGAVQVEIRRRGGTFHRLDSARPAAYQTLIQEALIIAAEIFAYSKRSGIASRPG